ncbi:hypothetical protein N0V90_000295 [Kalmusia sp. IMI 367209]|nr:hypothetical protein N0V90_000295 [Kalmusia sp. IMI 367209]
MSSRYSKRKRTDGPGEHDQGRNSKQRKHQAQNRHHPYNRTRKSEARQKPEDEDQISINALKNRGIRIERERELESCKHELEEKRTAQREGEFRNKIIGKYHHIRFFERQKATRTVKRLHKQLATLEDETDRAEKLRSIHNAEVDVNYTLYYPLLKPYISLFPKQEKSDSSAESRTEFPDGPKGDIDMWKTVEKAMEEQTLEALRESRDGVTIPAPPKNNQAQKVKTDQRKAKKSEDAAKDDEDEDEDEDEDGGFFFTDTAGDPSMKHVK